VKQFEWSSLQYNFEVDTTEEMTYLQVTLRGEVGKYVLVILNYSTEKLLYFEDDQPVFYNI
jgi:hypothetical protein